MPDADASMGGLKVHCVAPGSHEQKACTFFAAPCPFLEQRGKNADFVPTLSLSKEEGLKDVTPNFSFACSGSLFDEKDNAICLFGSKETQRW